VPFFASNPLQPLIDVFETILKFFHDTVGLQWGWSIIALTLLVRAALLPLTFKQFHSMQRLAHLQPEMKKIQDKYKNDKERMNQEVMRFYRENKVNPFSSCLPLVAQLPVFFSLFYMLRKDLRYDICPEVQVGHVGNPIPCGPGGDAGFLFIPDLTGKATGAVLVVLIVLYVGSQLFSTLLMSTTTDRNQKMIMLALPFVFVIFVIQFPAGLLVYWITTNLWTIAQQAIVRKRLGPLRPPESPQAAVAQAEADDRQREREKTKTKDKDRELVGSGSRAQGRPAGPPPAPPRKKKKRSGRRR
jgi:YidC/Oxa1 family membrane protein insertase